MEIQTITFATAILGAVAGLIGVTLGLLNTWRNISRDKVKLKVRPTWVMTLFDDANFAYQVQVINLSEFPITVVDVGFNLSGRDKGSLATVPGSEPQGSLPLRLEPRTSYSKIFDPKALSSIESIIRSAYARTECGVVTSGRDGNMRVIQNDRGRRSQD